MNKHLLLFLALAATTLSLQAQTAISLAGSPPDASAMFDVSATDKGMLIPRVALTSTAASAPITSPLTSLLVYNTAGVSDVTPGYYYWNGTSWTRLLNGASNLSGAGTTNYLARWTPNGNTLGIGVTTDNGTNVGIGSASPTQKLTVAGNINKSGSWIAGDAVWGANTFEIHNSSWDGASNNNYGGITGGHGYYYGGLQSGGGGGNEAAAGEFYVSGKSMLMGNVGVGTTTPNFKTDIQQDMTMSGDINPNTAQLSVGGTTTVGKRMLLGYDTNGNGFGFIKAGNYGISWTPLSLQPNGGNVGIGTTAPNEKLEIAGSVRGNQAGALRISTGSGYIDVGPQNTSWAHLQTDRSQFYFNKQIGVDGHAFPYLDNTYDLGLSGNRWRNLYLSGTIQGPGATQFIQNQNASAQAANFWVSGSGRFNGNITSVGDIFADQNYGMGLVGVYASTRYQNVFAMGAAYRLAADGTTSGNLYGIAWTHSNVGGQSKAGLGHQALFMDNGNTQTAIGSGIWTSGTSYIPFIYDQQDNGYYWDGNGESRAWRTEAQRGWGTWVQYDANNTAYYVDPDGTSAYNDLRANIFYDRQNTGYYVDPASTSNLNAVVAYSYQGNGNVGGTGSASWHPSGIYSAGYNWLYGGINGGGGSATNFGDVRANIFYDYQNTGYYVDPNGTSEMNVFTRGTLARSSLNALQDNSPVTTRAAQGDAYRNGSMGWGTIDFNVMTNWGSGFIDSWSNPGNAPGGSTHYTGIQSMHHTSQNSVNFYGWQMVTAGESANRYFLRNSWNVPRPWVEMVHSGNYTSFGDNLGNHSATTTLNLNNNALIGYGRLEPYGIGGNSGQGYHGYAIWQESGGWGWPYPDLIIRHHTGVRISAEGSYGGVKILATNGEGQTAHFDNNGMYLNTGWFRPYGPSGIYWENYGGGWNMEDGTWIRAYGSKAIIFGLGEDNWAGLYRGYLSGWNVSDGNRLLPSQGGNGGTWGYGYVGVGSDQDWYYMYSDNYVTTSARERKREITPLDEDMYAYVLNDLDKVKPTFYKTKGEVDEWTEGLETRYRPNMHLGLILDETPDYIQDNQFAGIDLYSLSVLSIAGVKSNRKEIAEIKQQLTVIQDFGTGNMTSNEFWVSFDSKFINELKGSVPVVNITPTSMNNGYYLKEITAAGFLLAANNPLSFNWHALTRKAEVENNETVKIDEKLKTQLEVSEETKAKIKAYWKDELKGQEADYDESKASIFKTNHGHDKEIEDMRKSEEFANKLRAANGMAPLTPYTYTGNKIESMDPSINSNNPDFYKTDPLVDPEYIKQEQMRINQEQLDALKKAEDEKKKNQPVDEGSTPLSEEYYNSLKENLPK